jgi:2-(1,2-epoxy-1,2-dihydrophenyl)acetyl-CoA isomerase
MRKPNGADVNLQPIDHLVDVDGAVATITLNRPAAYNALTADLLESLLVTLDALAADERVRAIVVTGAGKGFCSGQALDDRRSLPDRERPQLGTAVVERYNPLLLKLIGFEKPTVAAINGVAAGAGMGLALACDFRVLAETASFTTAFAKIGLVPDSAVSLLLPALVGYGRALELSLLAERIDARRADALGLATRVVPAEAVAAEAHALAAALAAGPRSIAFAKRELVRNGLGDVRAALAYEAEMQTLAGATDDFREGLAAFSEKRAPRFQGR